MPHDLLTAPPAQNSEEEVEHAVSAKPRPIARRTDWFWCNAHYRPRGLGPSEGRGRGDRVAATGGGKGRHLYRYCHAYGPGISETLIAEALHPYPAALVVATKSGLLRPGANRWVTDCRPEHLRRACAESLKRLRVECIEL